MKKVITYGTFDLFHYGHLKLLKRARELGDYLIVALSTDEFNSLKNKTSHFNYEERKEFLSAIKYVDEIIPETSWEQKEKDILDNNINIFVMGNDWEGKFDNLKSLCEVVYLERTNDISTTELKTLLKSNN
ncbi:MAG: glycerol-3-phosphate cytidylyltransferase [Candidatus Gastranaerophilales bacterium]|nr:glycerol-3-phosphate cytidylyltransferase [Candidatus Gastranaerophilales bacterium]